jgi:alpha-beta hydrolase superfamily lysophospholipase
VAEESQTADQAPTTGTLRLPGSLIATAYTVGAALIRGGTRAAAVTTGGFVPSRLGAGLIGKPLRNRSLGRPRLPFEEIQHTTDDGVSLRGWLFRPEAEPRGLLVYLHAMNWNRRAGASLADRYVSKGFAVLTYDQRGHGLSGGARCTYGVRETFDLRELLDRTAMAPIFLFGHSLGAAIAVQAGADPRVRGIVAASPYADLESAIRERAFGLDVAESMARFEREAGIRIADASPRDAAAKVRAPVLLIHGALDRSTPIRHSERILASLPGPKELLRVEGAGHGDILKHEQVWEHIDAWLARVAGP